MARTNFAFSARPEVTRGGCLVQTRFGTVDARRETKFDLLKRNLLRMTNPAEPLVTNRLEGLLRRVQETRVVRNQGRVIQLIGLVIESEGPLAAVGEICRIESARHDGSTLAEVVGFRNNHVLLMPLGEIHGIHPGSEVIALGTSLARAGGRVLERPRH